MKALRNRFQLLGFCLVLVAACTPPINLFGPSAPLPPVALMVDSSNPQAIVLEWQDVASDESGVEIERHEFGSSEYELLDTLPADATTYIDTTPLPGRVYRYRIRTTNGFGASPWVTSEKTGSRFETPVGDTFGFELQQYDIAAITVATGAPVILIEFTDTVIPPGEPNGIIGLIEIDADLNPDTGDDSILGYSGVPVDMGVDYTVDLFLPAPGGDGSYLAPLTRISDFMEVGTAVVTYIDNLLLVVLDEGEFDRDDGIYELAVIFGTDAEPTDEAGPFVIF